MAPETLVELVTRGGVIGVLVLVILGIWRRWLLPGWVRSDWQEERRELIADRDRWREAALRGTDLAENAHDTHERELIGLLRELRERVAELEEER